MNPVPASASAPARTASSVVIVALALASAPVSAMSVANYLFLESANDRYAHFRIAENIASASGALRFANDTLTSRGEPAMYCSPPQLGVTEIRALLREHFATARGSLTDEQVARAIGQQPLAVLIAQVLTRRFPCPAPGSDAGRRERGG